MENKRILIVEDERIAAEDLTAILKNMGYEVIRIVASGEAALEAVAEDVPDLVLMDIMLQGDMDGITAARTILQNTLVPIIFTTAYGDEHIFDRAEDETTPYGFIQKPYSDHEIRNTIRLALRRGQRDREMLAMNQLLKAKDKFSRVLVQGGELVDVLQSGLDVIGNDAGLQAAWFIVFNAGGIAVIQHQSHLGKPLLRSYLEKVQLVKVTNEGLEPDAFMKELSRPTALSFRFRIGEDQWGLFGVIPSEKVVLPAEKVVLQDVGLDLGRLVYTSSLQADRSRVKRRLSYSERRLRTIMDNAPSGIAVIGDDRIFEFINQEFTKLFGYTSDDLIGTPFPDIIANGRERAINNYESRREGKQTEYQYRIEIRHKDGHPVPVELTVSLFEDEDGSVKTISHAQDITERTRFEKEIRQLSQAVDQSPVSVVITDTNGVIQYTNPKFSEITGYTAEEALGRNPNLLKSGEQSLEYYKELWDTILSGKDWRGEFHNRKKGGELYWESASISPILDEDGEITSFIAVKEDITAKKAAEDALRLSEERFRLITDAALDAIIVIEEGSTISFWNPAAERIFGFSREEALDRDFIDLLSPDRYQQRISEMVEHFQSLVETENAAQMFEARALTKSGTEIALEIAATPIHTSRGVGILSIARDITARQEAESRLERAGLLRRALYTITNTAMTTTTDLSELYSRIHSELDRVVDMTNFIIALHHEGEDVVRLPFIHNEDDEPMPAVIPYEPLKSLAARTIETGKTMLLHQDEIAELQARKEITLVGVLPTVWLGIPLVLEEGIIGALVLQSYTEGADYNTEDVELLETAAGQIAVTLDRRQKEEDLIKSEAQYRNLAEELTDSNGMKELLLDVITHDLRNPASVISGIVELMEGEMEGNELIEVLRSSSDSLLKVIQNASVISKLTLGEQIAVEEVDLVELCREVVGECKTQLETVGMKIEFDLPDKALVQANPILSEVPKNYISNAIKYAADGGKIRIRLSQEGDTWLLEIIDYGPTVPEEKRGLIFERKVQLANGVKKGQGLGLAIVKRIAEAHSAQVGVRANKPRGNIFYLQI